MIRQSIRRGTAPILILASGLLFVAAAFLAPSTPSARALSNCDVGDYSLDSTEMTFLDLINEYRSSNGLNALTISTNLNRAAHWMGSDLGENAYFSHTDSLGRSPFSRAIDCGYPAGAGENLAAGTAWSSAQSAFDAWQASPGHNANMLNSFYRQIGIARVNVPGSPYGWYWVTNFGTTNDGTGGESPTSTPTQAPTSTPTPQPTNTPIQEPTNTPTPAPTQASPTPTSNPSNPPTNTPTATPAQSGSAGFSPPPTSTPTPAASPSQQTATPTRTSTPRSSTTPATGTTPTPAASLALSPGTNLIAWTGPTADPREALKNVQSSVRVVYSYDSQTKTWQRYGPDLPAFVNTLTVMENGEAYWVFTK